MRRLLCLLASAAALAAQSRYQPTWESLDQRATPAWFQQAKFGIFIHWGVYSVPAYAPVGSYAEWYWNALTSGRASDDPKKQATWLFHQRTYGADFPYQDFAPMFKAELWDPGHWADVFQRSGARYVVLTSKHHDGFALWPSKEASRDWGRPWNAAEIGPHRDLVGELTQAVRAKGLRMGLYYSLYEWYNPLWLHDRARYVTDHMHPQFQDVVTRYRPSLIFSDGEWDLTSAEWKSPELLAWLFNDSPVRDEVVVDDRWGKDTRHKHGGYYTTEYTSGMQESGHPWEESRGMGFSYGYNRNEELKDYHSSRELLLMLIDLVSRGGNLLLDIGPRADGHIPVVMEQRLIEMGDWLRVNGGAIYGTQPWKRPHQWSEGRIPEMKSSEFNTPYNITQLVSRSEPGRAAIEAFFTAKGQDVYAILPEWPGRSFVLKDIAPRGSAKVSLVGSSATLRWEKSGGGMAIHMPDRPASQAAYVLKLSGVE